MWGVSPSGANARGSVLVSSRIPAAVTKASVWWSLGSKRSRAELNRALKGLGSPPARLRFEPNDHQTDALVTAAGMRQLALTEPRAFDPEGLTPEIARSEGWTFGVL